MVQLQQCSHDGSLVLTEILAHHSIYEIYHMKAHDIPRIVLEYHEPSYDMFELNSTYQE